MALLVLVEAVVDSVGSAATEVLVVKVVEPTVVVNDEVPLTPVETMADVTVVEDATMGMLSEPERVISPVTVLLMTEVKELVTTAVDEAELPLVRVTTADEVVTEVVT